MDKAEKKRRYEEMLKEGMKPSEVLTILEGEEQVEREEQKQYKKEFRGREPKAEKEFIRPKVFESTTEADEYLHSLPPKERFEAESRLKGFKSGEERARVIEHVNIKRTRAADIEAAKAMYGTPQEKYEEIAGKARDIYGNLKESVAGTKKLGRQIAGLESRADIAPRLKKGFKEAGKTAVGTVALALTPRLPSDIRNLEKHRKELEKEAAIERKIAIEEKHQKKLEEIAAAGGVLTPSQRLSLEKLRLKYRYGRKQRPVRRPSPQATYLGGFGSMGGFNLGGARPVARPTQRIVSRQVERIQPQSYNPVNNPESTKALFGGTPVQRPSQRPIVRQQAPSKVVRTERIPAHRVEYRPATSTNPVNDTSGNFLVNMGGMGGVSSPVASKKKRTSNNDPTGAGAYW